MSVTFTKGATAVTLPDPARTPAFTRLKRQHLSRTQGGSIRVHDQGVATCRAEIPFESLVDTEKAELHDFFHTTLNGMMEEFTYTDEGNSEYTARFLEPELEFRKIAHNVHDITLLVELSAMPA